MEDLAHHYRMEIWVRALVKGAFLKGAVLACATTGAWAQAPVVETLEVTPSGEAYLQSLRFSRVDPDVTYFDPNAAAPDLSTDERLPTEQVDPVEEAIESDSDVIGVLALLVVVVIVAAILWRSGALSLSLRVGDEAAAIAPRPAEMRTSDKDAQPANLRAILQISDRREAIIALAQHALADALRAKDILPQRSWTARDALRSLARRGADIEPLRHLALTGEAVQFGTRDISEVEFNDHVARIRPHLAEQAA